MADPSRERRFFICCGPPKSGTTMLQRTLDLHPEVSCPSEHHLGYLFEKLTLCLDDYNRSLGVIDRRTGSQGARLVGATTVARGFGEIVHRIAKDAAGEKRIFGLNDNTFLDDLRRKHRLLGCPRLLVIFRHPLNMALSAWRHNNRLADLEGRQEHRDLMTRHGGIEGWVGHIAMSFSHWVSDVLDYARGRDDIAVVRYEDFVRDKPAALERSLRFLGARTDADTLGALLERSSFEAMRDSAGDPAFYHSAGRDYDAPEGMVRRVEALAGPAMRRLGYPAAAL